MNNNLRVRLFQSDLVWQSPEENLGKIFHMKSELKNVDILICPEMFTTGFSMAVEEIAEDWPGKSIDLLKNLSIETNTAIVCSLVVRDRDHFYNRLVFVKPDGCVDKYDKRHLFTMGEEHLHYSSGNERIIVEYKGWRLFPLVCYDLRFPVWSRNLSDYDALIYVANWPDSRRDVWRTLLKARALENQAYVLGVNRVGEDGMGLKYYGDTMAFSAKGQCIAECDPVMECCVDVVLDYKSLLEFRKKFPVLKDADRFTIQ